MKPPRSHRRLGLRNDGRHAAVGRTESLGWIGRPDGCPHLLEGQTRPSFIHEALADRRNLDVPIVLLDCRSDVRSRRLGELRDQPGLATDRMDN